MTFLLDTSILIEIENNNKEIIEKINELKENGECAITIFTLCEFYYGVLKKSEKHKNEAWERLQQYKIIQTTVQSASIFCDLRYETKKTGQIIGDFDLFIAALAIENNYTLLTKDNDFAKIKKLHKVIFL